MNIARFALLPEEQRNAVLDELGPEGCLRLKYDWRFWARENQLQPQCNWNIWLLLAGRGFGKTRVGAQTINEWAEDGTCGRMALVAEDAGDARDVMIEGESGILACSPPWFKPYYEPSKRRITWPNGAVATLFSSDDPESLRGPQFDGAWCDELAKWKYAQQSWDMLQFGMRLGRRPRQIVTTTPRPTKLIRSLLGREGKDVYVTRGSTYENAANLATNFMDAIVARYEGTRLGRQELDAVMLDDTPGALWLLSQLDEHRCMGGLPEDIVRTVVAVDPPASSGEGADECGIIVMGKGESGRGYVLADYSTQGQTPAEWAAVVARAVGAHFADIVVAEANNGGEMVETVLAATNLEAKIKLVHASKGKVTRAEPIAALYEQGRISHVGSFPTLEDQMCTFTVGFDRKKAGYSPDRVDALVWAATELYVGATSGPRVRSL